MKWILIVIFAHGYGAHANIQMQEFDSEETCRAVQSDIQIIWEKKAFDRLFAVVCSKK